MSHGRDSTVQASLRDAKKHRQDSVSQRSSQVDRGQGDVLRCEEGAAGDDGPLRPLRHPADQGDMIPLALYARFRAPPDPSGSPQAGFLVPSWRRQVAERGGPPGDKRCLWRRRSAPVFHRPRAFYSWCGATSRRRPSVFREILQRSEYMKIFIPGQKFTNPVSGQSLCGLQSFTRPLSTQLSTGCVDNRGFSTKSTVLRSFSRIVSKWRP